MKKRLIDELKKHILICGIGILYYLWVVITNIYIPCVFKMITGLKCPGCGITHMIVSLCRFDFLAAFQSNSLLLVILPIIGIFYLVKKIHYIRYGTKILNGKITHFFEYLLLVLVIIFWIVRNLPLN
ncbi:MAG: DUF2752 domain-containing protein [Ruminococcaceae bacterium]|nr:DUF2752 domain-containing protein [Oscillospiraceae bacterium]